jgi:DNA helicase-2/ATP-dependent DNA helicase PcrA
MAVLNAVDFGDLLVKPIKLFQRPSRCPQADYHRRFKFLLVDEYQDTNTAQYLWLRLLAQGTGDTKPNICCVGDDDQSIYGWRGAEVDNILRFERDFPGATVIRLERNYRSTSSILATASHLIAHNEDRLGKTLFTDIRPDAPRKRSPSLRPGTAPRKPARSARKSKTCSARAIRSTKWRSWCAPRPRCANSRTASSRSASTTALSAVRASMSARKSAMRWPICASCSARRRLAFERIVNVPKRGLGDTTVRKINALSRDQGMSPAGRSPLALTRPRKSARQRAQACAS